jgi:hypothetical protein
VAGNVQRAQREVEKAAASAIECRRACEGRFIENSPSCGTVAVMQHFATVALAGILCAEIVASAVPGIAAQATAGGETIRGRVASLEGRVRLIVSDDDGCIDRVELRRNTTITPAGLVLSVGMRVTIRGHRTARGFEAATIHAHYVYVRKTAAVVGSGACP